MDSTTKGKLSTFRVMGAAALVAGVLGVATAHGTPAAADPAAAVQSQDTSKAGVVAEVAECVRKDGVLTVKLRFRNTTAAPIRFTVLHNRAYDQYYVTAGDKKYFVLRDEEKTPLAVPADPVGGIDANLDPGGAWTWWAKYPAPPVEVKAVSYYTPHTPPFEDVPVTDR
jgi:hypothetical protein